MAAAAALLPLAQHQEITQMQALRHLMQTVLAYQRGADAGQLALRQVGMLAIEIIRRNKTQHRIAQEFQPLVAADALRAVLIGVGAVI